MVATGAPEAPLIDPSWSRGGPSQTFSDVLDAEPEPWNHSARATQDAALKLLVAFARTRLLHDVVHKRFVNAQSASDPLIDAFVQWLRLAHATLVATPRLPGRFVPGSVQLGQAPAPYLQYSEQDLAAPSHLALRVCRLPLMGWEASAPQLLLWRERGPSPDPPSADLQRAALEAFVRFACGDGPVDSLEQLRKDLVTPGWSYVLKELDSELDALNLSPPQPLDWRVAFRVVGTAPDLQVEPLLQKRRKGNDFSPGGRLEWRALKEKASQLEPEDLQVLRAYHDPMNKSHNTLAPGLAQETFSCLMALRHHPRVSSARTGEPVTIEFVPVTLRFVEDSHAQLTPTFELGPLTLGPRELKAFTRDGKHVVAQSSDNAATIILATLNPATGALMRAFASAPVKVAVQAKEELLARLAPVQPFVDIELPPSWVGEVRPAACQVVVRLIPQQTGSLQVTVFVRPLPGGPAWPPGRGPSVVLGGVYQQRHSVRRDFANEEAAVADVVLKLRLHEAASPQPHHYEIPAGDPVFAWLECLQALETQALVQVEWPRQGVLAAGPSVGRADLRLRVNTQRDWFSVEGAAEASDGSQIPLAALLTAAREGRQYVLINGRRFYKLQEDLRALLAQAGGDLADNRDALRLGKAQAASFLGLLDDPEQVQADATFAKFRKRLHESSDVSLRIGPILQAALRPYQKQGVHFLCRLAHWGAGAVLADEMGLGKTLQALAVLEHRATLGPALIVAPTSVGANWLQEAARFAPGLRMRAYRDGARSDLLLQLGPQDVLITSYAIVVRDAEALSQLKFATLVIDEAQAIKNAGTERARAIRGLNAEWKLALTGTPVENHLSELWSLFHTVAPGLLGSWQRFRAVFAVPIERYQDANRQRRLAQIIRPYVLRRRKQQVAQELPARTEVVRKVVLGPAEQRHYDTLRQATLDALSKPREQMQADSADVRMMLLAALTRLRQLACHPRLVHPDAAPSSSKLETLLRLALELRDNGSRALVFSQFRSFLDLVQPHLQAAGLSTLRLDGTTPAAARGPLVDAFQ